MYIFALTIEWECHAPGFSINHHRFRTMLTLPVIACFLKQPYTRTIHQLKDEDE